MRTRQLSVATVELREAMIWYRERSPHAAERLWLRVQDARRSIVLFPCAAPLIERRVRRFILSGFPYDMIYSALADECDRRICPPQPPTWLLEGAFGMSIRNIRAWLLFVFMLTSMLMLASAAHAVTYANTPTTFGWIDSSTHTQVGYNTVPYKFNGGGGCGTTPPTIDDTLSDNIPIGFTFMYGGVNFTQVRIMTNGRLQFNNNTTCGYGSPVTQLPYPNANLNYTMRIYGNDLDPTAKSDVPAYSTACLNRATCYVSYATLGTAPYRSFVVTWNNIPEWAAGGSTSGNYNLQVILQENGEFIYQYGANTPGPGNTTAQVGWQVNSTTDYDVPSVGYPASNSAIKFYIPRPVAEYRMEQPSWNGTAGEVYDTSGNGHHGTAVLVGATTRPQTVATGRVCRGAQIADNNATNAISAIDTNIAVPATVGNAGTISFWYNNSTNTRMLFDASVSNNRWFYLQRNSNRSLTFTVTDSGNTNRTATTGNNILSNSGWSHIVVSWNFNNLAGGNQDRLRIWVDGVLRQTSAFTTANVISPQIGTLYVGDNRSTVSPTGRSAGNPGGSNATLDEFRLYNFEGGLALVQRDMNQTGACTSIDHLRIEHSGSGVTCTPTTLTIKACADASCNSLYTDGVTGTMTATGAPTVNWVGGTGFSIDASGSVTKEVQVTTAGTVDWGTTGEAPAPGSATDCFIGATPSCSFTSALAGFLFDVPNHVSDTVQNITVSAVKQADNSLACVPAFASTSKTVNFACAYSDPASGTLPVTVGGSAVSCGGSGGVSLSFDATGVASTTVQYADVGQIALTASYSGSGGSETGLVMTGNDSFIAAPASFSVTGVTTGPIKAGNDFSATVTALNASGNATPNFGNETTPEGVTLTSTLLSGNNPGLVNGGILGGAFSNGVATVTTLSWGEVGNITLDAALTSGSYLGSGLTATGSSATVGAFIPDHFSTEVLPVSGVPMPCPTGLTCPTLYNGFVYSGQSFSVRVTALNLGGGTTSNYDGTLGFSKDVTLAAWDALGSTTTQNPGGGTPANNSITAASFTAGVATTATPTYTFAASTAPTDIYLRATDTDGATSLRTIPASSVEGGVKVVSGRVKVTNAYGSSLLPLTLPTTVQYYDGTRWLVSATDSITTLSLSASLPVGAGTTTTSSTPPGWVFASGNLSINLSAPGTSGIATVAPAIAVGSPGNPPLQIISGTATFGIYKGNNEMIYRREAY